VDFAAVKKAPVVGDDFLCLVELPRAALPISRSTGSQRQTRSCRQRARHRLRRQADLRKKRGAQATSGEVETASVSLVINLRVANDQDLNQQSSMSSSARRFLRQVAQHLC
jgi:hypothetical protein